MKYIFITFLSLFFVGCIGSNNMVIEDLKHKELTMLLSDLNKKVDFNEAKELANQSLIYSNQLTKDYDLATPPLYHNFLVNIGVKQRGLCWHFAYDMLAHTKELNLKSFDYYIGGANINDYWQEHNSLVVTCKGCEFNKGIVLDPWRNSGNLYFSNIKDDKNYLWTQRGELRN